MKKLVVIILVAVLCAASAPSVTASEQDFCVEQVAVQLINDALSKPGVFDLPDLTNETLYICDAIHPHTLDDSGLSPSDNIEYYLIRTDDEIIACITLCYVEGQVASACLNIGMAKMVNTVCQADEEFLLVVRDGSLYIKTDEGVVRGTEDMQPMPISMEDEAVRASIGAAQGNLGVLEVKSRLEGITINPVISRTTEILDVPYVSQEGQPICWAAAATALGRFYTGTQYENFSASALASMVGVGIREGAMEDAQKILRDIFKIGTDSIENALAEITIKDKIDSGNPILAGFIEEIDNASEEPMRHMVVVCGYDDSTSDMTIYVRDSNERDIKSVISYGDFFVVMDYLGGNLMVWRESAYKQES